VSRLRGADANASMLSFNESVRYATIKAEKRQLQVSFASRPTWTAFPACCFLIDWQKQLSVFEAHFLETNGRRVTV
jgi:hypothetical protein